MRLISAGSLVRAQSGPPISNFDGHRPPLQKGVSARRRNQHARRARYPIREIRFTRVIRGSSERKMPSRKRGTAFFSRCAAKTELCVTVFSLWALVSFDSRVLTAYPHRIRQLPDPRELAVDLFNRASK